MPKSTELPNLTATPATVLSASRTSADAGAGCVDIPASRYTPEASAQTSFPVSSTPAGLALLAETRAYFIQNDD